MAFSIHQLLIFAARADNHRLVEERLALGGDPNYCDPLHGSAACQAIMNDDVSILARLFQAGLNNENSPVVDSGLLECAIYYQREKSAEFLVYHGIKLLLHSRSYFREKLQEMLANVRQSQSDKIE